MGPGTNNKKLNGGKDDAISPKRRNSDFPQILFTKCTDVDEATGLPHFEKSAVKFRRHSEQIELPQFLSPRQDLDWPNLRADLRTAIVKVRRVLTCLKDCEEKIDLDWTDFVIQWKENVHEKLGDALFGSCQGQMELLSELIHPRTNRASLELDLQNVVI